jgi:hypothetical protein
MKRTYGLPVRPNASQLATCTAVYTILLLRMAERLQPKKSLQDSVNRVTFLSKVEGTVKHRDCYF